MSLPVFFADEQVAGWCAAVEERLARYVGPSPECPARLQEAMAYSLLSGGKRLRPLLVLMACEACGGSWERALPAACAVEMVHTYSLIHDDLPSMDDDDLRRGRPTSHRQFDEATAVLAGDALLTLAFEVLAAEGGPPEVAVACCTDLARGAGWCGMVGGQMADLQAERDGVRSGGVSGGSDRAQVLTSLEELEHVHRRKTGRLIEAALTLGGRVAGANPQTLRSLSTYGQAVGLAFQVADDLLDVRGDAERMGKRVRKDASSGKLTYPSLLGIEESQRRAERLVAAAREAIAPLGPQGHRLESVARYVIERDR
jgi:geranylgeranyl diphosphate synthase type II